MTELGKNLDYAYFFCIMNTVRWSAESAERLIRVRFADAPENVKAELLDFIESDPEPGMFVAVPDGYVLRTWRQ